MDVFGLAARRSVLYVPGSLAVSTHRLWRLDDLDVEPCAKRRDVRNGEIMFARVRLGRQGRVVAELGEAKGRQDGDDVGVVAKIQVEGLVEREGRRVGVERGVDLRARVAEGMVLETGKDFLLVADTDSATCLGLPAAVAGEEEIYRFFKIFLLVRGPMVLIQRVFNQSRANGY